MKIQPLGTLVRSKEGGDYLEATSNLGCPHCGASAAPLVKGRHHRSVCPACECVFIGRSLRPATYGLCCANPGTPPTWAQRHRARTERLDAGYLHTPVDSATVTVPTEDYTLAEDAPAFASLDVYPVTYLFGGVPDNIKCRAFSHQPPFVPPC